LRAEFDGHFYETAHAKIFIIYDQQSARISEPGFGAQIAVSKQKGLGGTRMWCPLKVLKHSIPGRERSAL